MKTRKLTGVVLSLAVLAMVDGCVLEEPREFGDKCDMVAIYTNGLLIQNGDESSASYENYFEVGLCPVEAPNCRTLAGALDDGQFDGLFCSDTREICPDDSHQYGDVCEWDSINNCGSHGLDCLLSDGHEYIWKTAECQDKTCIAIDCIEGYEQIEGDCKSADQCCGYFCKNCTRNPDTPVCSLEGEGICVAGCGEGLIQCHGVCFNPMTSKSYCGSGIDCVPNICAVDEVCMNAKCACPDGKIKCGKSCLDASDLATCGTCENNCYDISGWSEGVCEAGVCLLSECLPDYHEIINEEGLKRCELDAPDNCGSQHDNCEEIYTNYDAVTCVAGICDYSCADGQHKYENGCEADDLVNCGSHGNACDVKNAANSCEAGRCTFTCNQGYHNNDTDTACLSDNLDNCGGEQCGANKIPNGSGFDCISGVCVVTDCTEKYHVYENKCELNDLSNCGSHGVDCAIENGTASCDTGVCTLVSCSSEFHIFGDACEKHSIDNCGSHGIGCSILNGTPNCDLGTCIPSACDSNFHINAAGTGCEQNTIADCGASHAKCSVENADNACSTDGVCSFTCRSNYHKNAAGTGCEENSITDCGANHAKCNVENATNTCSTAGVCSFTCYGNYHTNFTGTGCDMNSPSDCGSSHAVCNVENADNTCSTDGICVFTCKSNYHKNAAGTGCEENSITDCGASHAKCNVENASNTCSTAGVCGFTCNSNYHKNAAGTGCEVNSITDCGASHAKCNVENASNTCSTAGVCGFTCNSNYHKNAAGTGCEVNSITDCGVSHAKCNVSNATNTCSTAGACGFTCNSNYHTNTSGTGCEVNSVSDCGANHAKCIVANADNSCSTAGVCSYTCKSGYHDTGNSCVSNDCSGTETTCQNISNIGQVRTCSGGVWGNASGCNNVSCNSAGTNCGVCKNGATQCSGRTPQTCSGGTWNNGTTCASDKICSGGTCQSCPSGQHVSGNSCVTDECTNGATKCTNNGTTGQKQICSGGVWGSKSNCSNSYSCNSAGTDCGVCVNNAKQCNYRTPQTCSGGTWNNGTTCASDKICSGGTCQSCPSGQHVSGNSCVTDNCDKGYYFNGSQCVKSTSCSNSEYRFYASPKGVEVLAYCIKSVSQLEAIRTAVNSGKVYPSDNTDNAYILAGNIKISSLTTGIGTSTYPFTGLFAGETGSSLVISSATTGGFGYVNNAVLVSLNYTTTIETTNSNIGGLANVAKDSLFISVVGNVTMKKSGGNIGGLVGVDTGSTFYSSTVTSSNITSSGTNIGGLVGKATQSSISTCTANVSISTSGDSAGGLVGYGENVKADYDEVKNSSVSCRIGCGGVFGTLLNSQTMKNVKAENNTINGDKSLGGFAGSVVSSTLSHCRVSGSVTGTGSVCGGFVGEVTGSSISDSVSLANVSSEFQGQTVLGGFAGYSTDSSFSSCGAFGDVNGYAEVGGFVGQYRVSSSTNGSISSSFAANKVSAYAHACGFVGVRFEGTIPAGNVYSFSKVTGSMDAYYFGEVDATAYYAYYYKEGCTASYVGICKGPGTAIALNGNEFPTGMYFSGERKKCTLSFGTYTIVIPSGITDLVTDLCQ